ncbi:MAG TPA: NAD(P)-binding domain-containing protein, partial [Saprospiraceae bacterium]|nr:NAD(P)-binding domain-containing protein [Saprospiraceae bacterium]
MKIAIIGTGNVGGALAAAWAKAGHQILLGVRDQSNFKGMELLANPGTVALGIKEAAAEAEVILVATPPQFAEDLAPAFGDVRGKVIIDATNAVRTRPDNYPTAYHAFAALTGAEVVKCFNTTGYENMLDPVYGGQRIEVFMAGDSDTAKQTARQLALDAGFGDCLDFGKSDKVLLLEQFALSWINLAIMQGHGRNIAF